MATVWLRHPELTDQLIELWNGKDGIWGKSAKEIAKILGHGLSRGAITNRVTRLRLSGVEMRSAVVFKPKSVCREGLFPDEIPAVKPKPIEPITLEDGSPITASNARDCHCRYPYNEPWTPDFRYCGRQVAKGSFCETHAKLCYQPLHQYNPNREAEL